MNLPTMTDSAALASRLEQLEVLLMHLQHGYDELHGVALAQAKRIDVLERKLAGTNDRLHHLAESVAEPPANEKPPHY